MAHSDIVQRLVAIAQAQHAADDPRGCLVVGIVIGGRDDIRHATGANIAPVSSTA